MVQTPIAYPPVPARAIATYNFTDVAEGTGIVEFNAFMDTDDSGNNYRLSEKVFFSSNNDITDQTISIEEEVQLGNNQPLTKLYDKDFDLSPFNFPKDVRGTAFFQCGIFHSTSGPGIAYLVVKLKKGDAVIASVQSHNFLGATNVQVVGLHFTVPRTHYEIGDPLRMTVELWMTTPSANTNTLAIGHDPINRDGTRLLPTSADIITQMKLYVPFVVLDA